MKSVILMSVTLFSTLGGFIASGSFTKISGWAIIGGTIGSFVGIWVGYKAGKYFGF